VLNKDAILTREITFTPDLDEIDVGGINGTN
jgi:hypothetical protein